VTRFLEKPTIYVVDDDDAVRDSLDAYLTLKGMAVTVFASAQELLERDEISTDLLILDVNMPHIDGFTLMDVLKDRGQNIPTVLITGLGDPDIRARSASAGAVAFLDKPIDTPVLYSTVVQVLEKKRGEDS
jgi:two-component system, LuxR family, response regulator FixJ